VKFRFFFPINLGKGKYGKKEVLIIETYNFAASLKPFKLGNVIYIEGETPKAKFYLMESGKVRLTKKFNSREVLVDTLEAGRVFGIVSAIEKCLYTETAEVLEDSQIFILEPANLKEMILTNPSMGLNILRELSARLRDLNNHLKKIVSAEAGNSLQQKLLQVGEYYHTNNKPKLALYVFKKYLTLNPEDSKISEEVQKKISTLEI
jgi:CRP/FNR family cyclic AMP-dependent transcriptional regulator